ncbi:caspase family protein [Bradyrhizobium sp. 142]|uniref:caspase family protein n=1 Tax=Bradyrhizobium sp. 142 TaxID=2782618 RepID=UPI001FFB33A6|nr:caspase family protein [Bradyrhizobium sp. 142]MCK1732021.1 caspase family protein [Bradyrhizobium sp. 142]
MPEHPNPKQSQGDATAARETSAAKRRAVVVGINDYQSGNNRLPSCINDVNSFEKMLKEDYAFQEIVRLVDSDATVANVTAALQKLLADASPDDRVVFFFSGHGSAELRSGLVEECMVLYDGYLFDDALSQITQSLPPGIFTLIADCCFSGGLEKRLLMPVSRKCGETNRARVKAYTHPTSEKFIDHVHAEDNAVEVKRFGVGPLLKTSHVQAASSAFRLDKTRPVQLNGVLLSACLESEPAAASTPSTGGKSAFTFALLQSLKERGRGAPLGALTRGVQSIIEGIGLTQTPTLKEPPVPGDLRLRTFINFDQPKLDESWETGANLTSGRLDIVERARTDGSAMEGSTMDASTLIQLLTLLAKENIPAEPTISAKENAILASAIASMVAAAFREQQFDIDASSFPGQAGQLVGDIARHQRSAEQKLFGINNASLLPTIASIVRAIVEGQQPDRLEKSLVGHALRVAPMIASVIRALIKGQ